MTDLIELNKVIDDLIEISTEIAIDNERAELNLDKDLEVLEMRMEYYHNKAKKYNMTIFKINAQYDFEDLNEYLIYFQEKLVRHLRETINAIFSYPNLDII